MIWAATEFLHIPFRPFCMRNSAYTTFMEQPEGTFLKGIFPNE